MGIGVVSFSCMGHGFWICHKRSEIFWKSVKFFFSFCNLKAFLSCFISSFYFILLNLIGPVYNGGRSLRYPLHSHYKKIFSFKFC